MAIAFAYRCPFCDQHTTITDSNFAANNFGFNKSNVYGEQLLSTTVTTCPNPKCRKYGLNVSLHDRYTDENGNWRNKPAKQTWRLVPASAAVVLPDYVPQPIIDDYEEACAIQEASPKASATLSRRCLQGVIRDFWGVSKDRLADEIDAISTKVDPLTWDAIDAVRKVGNIGAHMEKDINVIVDVEPEEAGLLIGLIETVIKDWYIARHEREKRLKAIVALSKSKDAAKKNGTAKPPSVAASGDGADANTSPAQ